MPRPKEGIYVGNQWEVGEIPMPDDRLVGIEIEVENAPGLILADPEHSSRPAIPQAPNWCQLKDGSLRNNGAEFVSFPLPVSKVAAAVDELFKYQDMCGHKWVGSIRTGFHVHVSVRDFMNLHLQNLTVAYPLVEPALFEFVGADREECIYCVPWYRAPGDAKLAAQHLDANSKRPFFHRLAYISQHIAKYSSLYLAPVTRIGTVEFRHAPTWLDKDKVVEWARICESIVTFARKAESPQGVLDLYEKSPTRFLEKATNGFLTAPKGSDYGMLVTRSGADVLASSLYPDTLEEWVRVMDGYKPLNGTTPKAKPWAPPKPKSKPGATLNWSEYSMAQFASDPIPKPAKSPKVGDVQMIGFTKYYFHGDELGWVSASKKPPPKPKPKPSDDAPNHGWVKYNPITLEYEWYNASTKKWVPYDMVNPGNVTAEIAASKPVPPADPQVQMETLYVQESPPLEWDDPDLETENL